MLKLKINTFKFIYYSIMSDINDYELDLHGYQNSQTYALCLQIAKGGILVEFQTLEFNNVDYFEFNDKIMSFQS